MEIGTAIFLSALLVALVLLYGFTRDRIRWGRIIKLTAILIVVLGVVLFAGLYFWSQWENRRVAVAQIAEVRLGDTYKDVIFRKGKPYDSCYINKETKEIFQLRYNVLSYDGKSIDQSTYLFFDENQIVRGVQHVGELSRYSNEAKLSHNDSTEDVIARWGEPDKIEEMGDSGRRYIYSRYNFTALLDTNKVIGLEMGQRRRQISVKLNADSKDNVVVCADSEGKITRQYEW